MSKKKGSSGGEDFNALELLDEYMEPKQERHYANLRQFGGKRFWVQMPITMGVISRAEEYQASRNGSQTARLAKILQLLLRKDCTNALAIPTSKLRDFEDRMTQEEYMDIFEQLDVFEDDLFINHEKESEEAKKNSVATLPQASNS